MGIFSGTIRYAAASVLVLSGLTMAAVAGEGESNAQPPVTALRETNPAKLMDSMSLLKGAPDAWSVSRTDAGCYLLSPHRKDSSRLAIGRHPKIGLGIFVINFGLSVPEANEGERVAIQAAGSEINAVGRLVGVRLLYMPLDRALVDSSLQELKDHGSLWLLIRHGWIAHSGEAVSEAVAKYGEDCAGAPGG